MDKQTIIKVHKTQIKIKKIIILNEEFQNLYYQIEAGKQRENSSKSKNIDYFVVKLQRRKQKRPGIEIVTRLMKFF